MGLPRAPGFRLELAPFRLEKLLDYGPCGLHPVHLGDFFGKDGRYRVLYKLGHGGFATVWLCRDTDAKETTRYVALKILGADASTEDCPELHLGRLRHLLSQESQNIKVSPTICLPLD